MRLDCIDHTGVTPLIQAVRNGHLDVVRVLLEKGPLFLYPLKLRFSLFLVPISIATGADPTNSSSQGRPDQYTHDAAILELFASTRENKAPNAASSQGYPQPGGYSQDPNADPSKGYYAQAHPPYVYYPAMHPGAAMMPDGSMPYYASPPLPSGQNQPDAGGLSNLPPPEVARMIPCR